MTKCTRCENPTCEPAQLPGSKTPCMTCGQPYGNHCITRHVQTQFAPLGEGGWERYSAMVEQNRALCGELPDAATQQRDMVIVGEQVLAAHGLIRDPGKSS